MQPNYSFLLVSMSGISVLLLVLSFIAFRQQFGNMYTVPGVASSNIQSYMPYTYARYFAR